MATRIFGIDPGDGLQIKNVVENVGPTATSAIVAVVVDLATSVSDAGGSRTIKKSEVLEAIEALEAYILKSNWPPA